MRKAGIVYASVGAVFVGILILVFWNGIAPPPGMMLFGDDFFRSYVYFREYFAQSIRQGVIPWWNPYLFSGTPLIANPSVSFWYPPNWLFVVLPSSVVYPVVSIFHVFLAMLGMVYVLRAIGVRDLAPQIFSSVAFGLSGYVMARIWAGHTEIIASVAYMPWVIGSFLRAFHAQVRRTILYEIRILALPAVLLAIQIIAGYQTIAFFTLISAGILAVAVSIGTRSLMPLVRLVVGTGIGVALAAFQLIPSFEYFAQSIRTYHFGYEWAARGSLVLASLRQFIQPFFWGDQYTFAGPPPNYHEQAGFFGATTVVMGVYALILFIRRTLPARLGIVAFGLFWVSLFGLVVSLGNSIPLPIHAMLWNVVPLYQNLRFPARHILLVVFASSILGGMGVSCIRHTAIRWFVVGLLLVELIPFARHFIEVRPIPGSMHDTELVARVGSDDAPYRLLQNFGVWVPPRDALDFDSVMTYGVYSATGYDPSILQNYYAFIDAANGKKTPSIDSFDVQVPYMDVFSDAVDFLNIKYLLDPPSYDPASWFPGVKYRALLDDPANGYRLYENESVMPRYFLVPRAEYVKTRDEAISKISDKSVNLKKAVLLSDDTMSSDTVKNPCHDDVVFPPVVITSYGVNAVTLTVDTPCDAFLSSSEVMYPGWTAWMDRQRVAIQEGNGAFRTLFVPKGTHIIEFRFIPYSVYVGWAVSAGVTLLIFLFSWHGRLNDSRY